MSDKKNLPVKKILAGILFALLAIYLAYRVPNIEIAWVSAVLIFTIYLFAFEIVDVDVAAITIMVLLGLSSLFAPLMGLEEGLVSTSHLFDGFASNAVMSIIAVMIIGAGLDKTGIMGQVAAFILQIGGSTEKRIIPIISGTVAFISSFMQNVGAAALFLPVVSRISARSGIDMSRLLMPMGFCAILGGTVTMVGSSPLILLNDLILNSNRALSPEQQMETWGLFSVTPIGIALVLTGIVYFVVFGRFVLPASKSEGVTQASEGTVGYLNRTYDLGYDTIEIRIRDDSPVAGKNLLEVEEQYHIRVVAMKLHRHLLVGPNKLDRDLIIEAGTRIAIVGIPEYVEKFAEENGLRMRRDLVAFADALSYSKSGIAELVITPTSSLMNKSAKDIWLRKRYGLTLIGLISNGQVHDEREDILDIPFKPGDTLIAHTTWETLARLEKDKDFVVVTTEFPHEETRPHKVGWAGLFFLIALSMVLFSDLRLSVALLTGALGMIWSGVLTIDEAYDAVSWKTVFLLASLIPLGLAVETSGTAAWIADQTLAVLGDVPDWTLQAALAVLATFFTLVMSNVGATVLLVPLAVNIAVSAGANPAMFALTVALATSNSFIIPTHQVNALIMGPGGYRVADFMKSGGIMTILFLVVMLSVLNLLY
ncbi:MAG: anion permease [Gammaproteobacteria bacterium]|nr:anion permease [Gammaproteobacteria bacterium]